MLYPEGVWGRNPWSDAVKAVVAHFRSFDRLGFNVHDQP